jgi:SOS response regulatory protein OraA/RecX
VPEPLEVAARALARRDYSERELRDRLARAGVEVAEAEETLAALRERGLVDDGRFAVQRATVLAERGRGDAAIRFELERQGVSAELIEEAVVSVEPERDRIERIVSRHGAGSKTARLLAQRGFDPELVALAVEARIAPEA